MSDQPEALLLAEWIESDMTCDGDAQIAAELRRQHAEIEALKVERDALQALLEEAVRAEREACAKVCEDYQDAVDRINRPTGYDCAAAIRERGGKA